MANGDLSYLGKDFDLGFIADEEGRVVAGPFTNIDLRTVRRGNFVPARNDLSVIAGVGELVQALIMRLMTERGELAVLGHPEYGSRHHTLIGEPNTEGNRNLLKLYILECLRQERRLQEVMRVDVKEGPGRENRDKVDVSIEVRMKGVPDPLNLVVPFSFGGAVA
jgi:hypothetical protein